MSIDTSTPRSPKDARTTIIVGVDTHKYLHVAVAISRLGARLDACTAPADREGYAFLLDWARRLGTVEMFAVEGTGSYGAGLASYLRRLVVRVVEVSHCDRRRRRKDGKSDTLDAESAARSALAGTATAVPKSADGTAEMVRQLKIVRDTVVKARSAAMIALKALLVNFPGELRERLAPLTDRLLIEHCALLAPADVSTPASASRHAVRALAHRWRMLSIEISGHDEVLDVLTAAAVPTLRGAFAKLCGACSIPASSGVTNRHRLFRGGHRQANAALYRIVIVRLRWHQPAIDYVTRRTAQGLSKKDIIRCLKRFVAREIYHALLTDHNAKNLVTNAAA